MRLIYTPEDGEKREFVFVPRRLMSPEAEAIENVGGEAWDSFDEFGQKFMKGNRRAYRAALWIMLRRDEDKHGLKFSDLVIRADEVEIDFDREEKIQIREAIAADPNMDPEQVVWLLAEIDVEIGATDDVPKDPSGSDSTSARTVTEPSD